MTNHVYVIVDYTDPANIREISRLFEFHSKAAANVALDDWRELMKGNMRRYKVKAKTK